LFAPTAILTVCAKPAICAQPDGQTRTVIELSEKQLHSLFPELAALRSADSQAELPMMLQHVAASEQALLRNIPDLTSREDIAVLQQAHAGEMDRVVPVFSGKYTYLVLAHRDRDGLHLFEYRTDVKGKEIKPGLEFAPASTQGFALVALLFDPFYQNLATFRYLGRQQVEHREMYVVAFAQRRDAAQLTGQIKMAESQPRPLTRELPGLTPSNSRFAKCEPISSSPDLMSACWHRRPKYTSWKSTCQRLPLRFGFRDPLLYPACSTASYCEIVTLIAITKDSPPTPAFSRPVPSRPVP
jgi:hypothetical protein